MARQPRVIWALVASALVHAALVTGLMLWPARAPRPGTQAPGRTCNVFYLSMESPSDLAGQLAPGDIGAPALSGLALPHGPIDVRVEKTQLGPALSTSEFGSLAQPGPGAAGGGDGQNAGSGGAGAATTTFFGVSARGQRIVYVLDRSGSMGLHRALDLARRELEASLALLPASASFQIIDYNTTAEPLLGRRAELVPATAENIRRATAALEALTASGTTRHLPALTMALAMDPDVIYFLTDADDLESADQARLTRINGGRCVIHTIELTTVHRGDPDMPMQRLARDNRGTYLAIDPFH